MIVWGDAPQNKQKNEMKSDGEETKSSKLLTNKEVQITKILMYVVNYYVESFFSMPQTMKKRIYGGD